MRFKRWFQPMTLTMFVDAPCDFCKQLVVKGTEAKAVFTYPTGAPIYAHPKCVK